MISTVSFVNLDSPNESEIGGVAGEERIVGIMATDCFLFHFSKAGCN